MRRSAAVCPQRGNTGAVVQHLVSIAIICGVVALIIFPIVFGPIGIVLAAIGASRGEPRWKAAMAVVVVLMLISMALGAYFATRTH